MINFGRAFKSSRCGCTPAGNGKEEPWHVVHCAMHREAPKVLKEIRKLLVKKLPRKGWPRRAS